MSLNLQKLLLILISISFFVNCSSCSNQTLGAKTSNHHAGFKPALATWYGEPNGAGSGGACGWGNDVELLPYASMIAAGNANLFLKGKGCGTCYEVFCTREPYCSKDPIAITITDECPGDCNKVPFAFDLSGYAFGAMANPRQADDLRNLGQVDIQYRRVACNYGVSEIVFKIDPKVNPYWFAMAVEFCQGDGGLEAVEIAANGSKEFRCMENIWGAVWAVNIDPSFRGPFSIRLISRKNHEAVVAFKAIPYGFVPGQAYYSKVNFRV